MLRSLIYTTILLAVAWPSHAAVWTEEFFGFHRTSIETLTMPDDPIWDEYGFEEGERAVYTLDGVTFTATAWRFNDTTSAMAVYQWKRPEGYTQSKITELAVESGDNLYMATGNYILQFEGYKPTFEQLQGLLLVLPRTERSSLPALPGYLPAENRVPGSERYVIGPEGMSQFDPGIPLSVVAFQYSTEVQVADYQTPAGPLRLNIISYPTPTIARERLAEFRMLDNILVKREGTYLVAAVNPPDPEAAQRLLGQVNYRATVSWDEVLPDREWTMSNLIVTAGIMVGLLLLFATLAGFGLVGLRTLQRKLATGSTAPDEVIGLHLLDD